MLTTVKAVHTAIYAVMVAAIFYVLYCGVTGTLNVLLAVSIGLVGLEVGSVLWERAEVPAYGPCPGGTATPKATSAISSYPSGCPAERL